ncbi:MAG: MurR/RpiR family transcriptional regulator [Pseudomonadota bacterium]
MEPNQVTVAERLNARQHDLTRAEIQVSDVILSNYPASGLGSITDLAEAADVSTPTIARMVQKLDFAGYPEFQAKLRSELNDILSNPIAKRETWVASAPDEHILNRFTQEATENIRASLEQLDPKTFDRIAALIADPKRRIHIAGGRITQTLANYLFLHLQMIRSDVVLVPSNSNAWPHYLLDLSKGDILVVFDIRRYEGSTQLLVEMARERGAEVILFTDQWRSPIRANAAHTVSARIKVPSAWDSSIAILLVVEAAIAAVQELHWDDTRDRTEELEGIFDRTGLFRKFV